MCGLGWFVIWGAQAKLGSPHLSPNFPKRRLRPLSAMTESPPSQVKPYQINGLKSIFIKTISKITSQEDLFNLGKEITRLMLKKKQADEHLVELEARIYSLETEYFKETGAYGSIMTGLEGYLGLASGSGGQTGGMRRSAFREVKDTQRIFSNTSTSSRRAVSLYNKFMSVAGGSGRASAVLDEDYLGSDEEGEQDDVQGSQQKRARTTANKQTGSRRRR